MGSNKQKKYNSVTFKIHGYHFDEMIELYVKSKLGKDIEQIYTELIEDKIANKNVLNSDDNEFSLFVEYRR